MATNMTTFNSYLLKQCIVFIILFQTVFCGLIETKDSRKIRSPADSSMLSESQYKKVTTCLEKIKLGDISAAVDNYDYIYPPVPISDILNISYHSEDIDNELIHFKNMIEFVKEQKTRDNDEAAIETLHNLLNPSNHLDYFKAVMVSYLIEASPAKNILSMTYIHLKLKHFFLHKIKDRVLKVLLDGYYDEELKQFNDDYYEYFLPLTDEIFLETIDIKENLTNSFDNILKFVRGYYHHMETTVQVYSSLYNEVVEKDLLTNDKIAPKFGADLRRFKTEESNFEIMSKVNRDTIENMCNTLDYCKNETLYNELLQASGATSVYSLINLYLSIFIVTYVIVSKF